MGCKGLINLYVGWKASWQMEHYVRLVSSCLSSFSPSGGKPALHMCSSTGRRMKMNRSGMILFDQIESSRYRWRRGSFTWNLCAQTYDQPLISDMGWDMTQTRILQHAHADCTDTWKVQWTRVHGSTSGCLRPQENQEQPTHKVSFCGIENPYSSC